MRNISTSIAAGLLAFSASASVAQFKDQCAWGLAHRKRVKTAGAIKALCADGKTYCFSNEQAREAFMQDSAGNAAKAIAAYIRT